MEFSAQQSANIRVEKPEIVPFLLSENCIFINAILAAFGIAQASLALLSLARDFPTLPGLCRCIGKGRCFQENNQSCIVVFYKIALFRIAIFTEFP